MKVFLIPSDKAEKWTGKYNGHGFAPIEDASGNKVVSADADYSQFPFYQELISCDIIDYVPKPFSFQ
jgi:bacillopeptidase F (M6 metalloprotease family)